MRIEASLTAEGREGLAWRFGGRGMAGRYLMFSWKWLMRSVKGWGSVEYGEVGS